MLFRSVKGVSISTATNWLFNWIVRALAVDYRSVADRSLGAQVGQSTPVLQETIRWRLYPMHAFFCLCSFVVVYFFYPGRRCFLVIFAAMS